MITLDLFQLIAAAFAMCGLAVVIWEIAVKDPHSFREIAGDVRRFAERPVAPSTERGSRTRPGRCRRRRRGYGRRKRPAVYFVKVTGTLLRCSTLLATEPSKRPATLPSPRVPMTIPAQPFCSA